MNILWKNKSKLILILLLIEFLLFNSFGFCWGKLRFLSDQERIEIAVRRSVSISESADSVIETTQGIDGAHYYTKVQDVIPYENLEEFYALNPNCCEVSRRVKVSEGHLIVSWYGCLSGISPYFVRGKYTLRYKEDGQVKTEPREFAYYISSCGKLYYLFD